jgi:hypothetical protein
MRRRLVPQKILAGLIAVVALPMGGVARAHTPAPSVPAAPASPSEPQAWLDPSRLSRPAISPPQILAARSTLPLGAATQELLHIVGTRQTHMSAAPAQRLHGSTEIGRRYWVRESQAYDPNGQAGVQKVIGRDERVRVGREYPNTAQ